MAIFSKKTEDATGDQSKTSEAQAPVDIADSAAVQTSATLPVVSSAKGRTALILPRLSEKASFLTRLNKYVFRIEGRINKIELRKAIEKGYGVKVADINMISVKGKNRRAGRTPGTTSKFKKAIVTLTPDSKKIEVIEPA
jgi:large subunit ribosomal protein L23